ncbi:UNVERIFIED_CONTAM: Retrovirus-related Pol polyprotein from transposon [Sesamum radiatum]|uniref:Retrovirus-related Pol polyprotein from transposon n=1 Tax=Sesamum radiatum TaxID=300843 RepID=A0AAW2T6R1_SESRA
MMDASQGYHQIVLAPEDHKRVSFITSDGTFCYVAMPFGLKNARATYQRLVDKIFRPQLGRNMEVYVDDMLVKIKEAHYHIKDLDETFTVLRNYRLKLNLGKCAFGVSGGCFLGFMMTQQGIEANQDKIKVIMDMGPPTSINEIQRLTGRTTALSRFISKSAEKGLLFFKILRKVKNFEWTKECQQAFKDLKTYLARLSLRVKPVPRDTLYLYISMTAEAVSLVLVGEEEGNQTPIYYVSKVLNRAKNRYPPIEKMALTLVITARKLRPYFLSYPVGVRTNTPLKQVLCKPKASGRLVKNNPGRDFISETLVTSRRWSSITQGSGARIVLTTPQGNDMEFAVKFEFKATNNEAEYEALVLGMRMAQDASDSHLLTYTDSQLIVKQVNGEYEAKKESMVQYLQQIKELKIKFKSFQLQQIPSEENIKADSLSN